jgi:hypothetical protein
MASVISPQAAQDMGMIEVETIVASGKPIAKLHHPEYDKEYTDWEKWRLTYESGDNFLEEYLEKFSTRETDSDFLIRKGVSYVPAFAKAGVNDVKDAIFQRIADVARNGGSDTYNNAVVGLGGGVDLAGTTMNSFIGRTLLPELLTMSKVGVFVDMPQLRGETLSDQLEARPYIYYYPAESILNWSVNRDNNITYDKLLLRDNIYKVDEATGLPEEVEIRYRYMWVRGQSVLVQFFDKDSKPIDRFGNSGIDVIVLNLPKIPFVLFEISDSLLTDVANYQIALLNLASSDIAYSLKSNFPFYVEMFDPRVDNLYSRSSGNTQVHTGEDSVSIVQAGERDDSVAAKTYEIEVGATTGRRIPKGLEMPQYIYPSSDPLEASMKKQDELKKDIRMLIGLTVSSLTPKMASAESKSFDERTLEAGLSAIGLELEHGERLIAQYWQLYEKQGEIATVKYPQKYSLQSDKDKREEAKDLQSTAKTVPSPTYKREIAKQVAKTTLGTKVALETLEEIETELDEAKVLYGSPEELQRDVESGLIDLEAASKAKGYPEGSVEKAASEHAERVARIAESQAKARGVDDLGGISNSSREEKVGQDEEGTPRKKTRGVEP